MPLPVSAWSQYGVGLARQREGGFSELVSSLGSIERVKTISDIYINPNFDSVLEARFIESLKKISGVGGLPTVRLVQDVVNGKSGYVLEVGGQRYRMEPQADLNGDYGVVVAEPARTS